MEDRRNIGFIAVLGTKLVNRAEVKRAQGTGTNANGLETQSQLIKAAVALGHEFLDRIVLRSTVGAGPFTVTAADTEIFIDDDKAIFRSFVHRRGGARFHAGRISAMIAGD